MCLAFDVSSTNQALAFGDNAGSIHLFSSSSEPIFNTFSRMTEHADHPATVPGFAVDDYETPLSIVPFPLDPSGMPLASDWPEHLTQKCYRFVLCAVFFANVFTNFVGCRKAPPIDAEILRTMKIQGPIGYAPNPKATRRNQVRLNNKLPSVYFC